MVLVGPGKNCCKNDFDGYKNDFDHFVLINIEKIVLIGTKIVLINDIYCS